MYRIAVVAEQEREAFHYAEQIARFCGEKGMFPKIEPYDDLNAFLTPCEGMLPPTPSSRFPGWRD